MSEAAEVVQEQPRKQAANVVTSENLADFQAKKLGLAAQNDPTEAADAEPVVEQGGSESEPEQEAATGEKKQNPKLEKRFSELTKQREAARQEAEREREARQALEARLKDLESKVNPPKSEDPDPKPDPAQFNDAIEYAEALAEWTADKKMRERDQAELARRAQEEQSRLRQKFQERLETAKQEMPDYEDMIASSDVAVSQPVTDAIIESDVGPQILYYLAENPDFARGLAEKSITSQLRAIGRLEAKFEKTEAPKASAKEPVAKKSNAPAPINPLKAGGNPSDVALDSNREFHGTYAQWKAARAAGKIR
jgi:DNA repair exonuclease SbcCD ATPase subunit